MKRLIILIMIAAGLAAQGQNTLIVADGTATSSYVPIYGLYIDEGFCNEMIYPAGMLEEMFGADIQSVTFHTPASQADISTKWADATVKVYLSEVAADHYTASSGSYLGTDMTLVYSGSVGVANHETHITFDTPYRYEGGNLCVKVVSLGGPQYQSATYLGVNTTDLQSVRRHQTGSNPPSTYSNALSFLPKCTFGYGTGGCNGDVCLALAGGSGHAGDTVTVSLGMTNNTAVTALQAFVPMGNQMTYVAGSAVLNSSRSNGHQLTATVLRDTLRLYSYSLALNSFAGDSGEVLSFRVVLGREPGNHPLRITSPVLSAANGTSVATGTATGTVTVLAPKVQVTPAALDYGHVPIRSSYTRSVTVRNTGNEPLTLSGVVIDDAHITASPATATLAAGGSCSITLTYSPVTAGATTMTAVFRTNATVGDSVVTIAADPYAVNELRPLNVSGYTDSVVTVELRMNNMDSIVGLQTSLVLPTALTYEMGSFAVDATRANDHVATAGLQGDTLTLLVTSLGNHPLHGSDGVVARFRVRLHGYGSYTLQLRQTALSDSAGRNVLSAVYTGTVSIYSPYLSCNSSVDLGNTPVTEPATATLPLRNTGNAPLVVDRVVFTQDGWQLENSLPLTIANSGRDTLHIVYSGTAEGSHSAELLLYTNDPRNELKRIGLTAQRYEPNALYLEGNAEAPAAMPEVSIMLDNYSEVTALQLDVQYPHRHFGLEPQDITLGERASSHIVSAARQNDSTLRVLVLSMQNGPFAGNSGSVVSMRLHAQDTLDGNSYPITLLNVTSGSPDGVDRLSSVQSTGWFATRVVHDTTVVEVHDTTLVPYAVHDTTIVHDTTLVPYAVHDTTIVHDTTLVPYAVHDTTIVHDTTLVPYAVHDTTYINVPYPVHDTTYISVHDTTVVTEYLPVHDTTYIYQTDTLWLTDTVYLHDTIYITEQGVDDVETAQVKVYQQEGRIVVDDPQGREVAVYDAVGRRLAVRRRGESPEFEVPASGVYLVKVDGLPARRVVVVR
ncbi:MAG: choice-of-anchor D domain-containing protein [Bacteroidales bacterium]|nr:choice-of-anchor D domain-containing protein [Bacteroidales bacterium]